MTNPSILMSACSNSQIWALVFYLNLIQPVKSNDREDFKKEKKRKRRKKKEKRETHILEQPENQALQGKKIKKI